MSHFPHPKDPAKTKPLRETPRWQKRHLGVVLVVAVLGFAAWHYGRSGPPSGGLAPPVDPARP